MDVHKIFANFFSTKHTKAYSYAVSKKLSEGHICLNIEKYNKNILNNIYNKEDNPFLEEGEILDENKILDCEFISQNKSDIKPFILNRGNIYMQRYYHYESEIIGNIFDIVKSEQKYKSETDKRLIENKELIQNLFSDNKKDDIDWQLVAAINSIRNNFSIITGGPGTGKTTTVAKLLAVLFSINISTKVVLAAPTGKASARMKESLIQAKNKMHSIDEHVKAKLDEIDSLTIHRLLGFISESTNFIHNKDNRLSYDIIIIDESSMISLAMMSKLLESVKKGSKIIFIGDKDQLSSVEAGSVFGDICLSQNKEINKFSKESIMFLSYFMSASNNIDTINNLNNNILNEHIVELLHSHRFSSKKGIGKFSKRILNGSLEKSHLHATKDSDEYVEVENNYDSENMFPLIDIYKQYIEEEDNMEALKKLNRVRFLCAVKDGPFGVDHYNSMISTRLEHLGLIKTRTGYYHNQAIIINKNDYTLSLFNGDIGIVRINHEGVLKAYFEDSQGGLKVISPGYINSFDSVYAMTIHKSQGSEFDNVAIILPKNKSNILSKELLYTAITRAKKRVIIFASDQTILNTSATNVERSSGISERIMKEIL